jgi:hypothetical protein
MNWPGDLTSISPSSARRTCTSGIGTPTQPGSLLASSPVCE